MCVCLICSLHVCFIQFVLYFHVDELPLPLLISVKGVTRIRGLDNCGGDSTQQPLREVEDPRSGSPEALTLILHRAQKTRLCSFIAKQEQILHLVHLSATTYYLALSQRMEDYSCRNCITFIGTFIIKSRYR